MKQYFTFQKNNTWGNRKGKKIKFTANIAFGAFLLIGIFLGGSAVTQAAVDTQTVVITEFMADPTAVSDVNGEWIEIENRSTEAIDITNWDINGSTITGNVVLVPKARAVICKNENKEENGSVICNARSGFSLSQSGDTERTILLRDASNTTVDTVTYVGNRDIVAGRSNYTHAGQLSVDTLYTYNNIDYGTPDNNQILNTNLAYIGVNNATDLNKNGAMDFNGETGIHNAGWRVRLYDTSWNPANFGENGSNEVVTAKAFAPRSGIFRAPAGNYFICQVSQHGRPQSFVATILSFMIWEDRGVPNGSGNIDEDETCISTGVLAAGQRQTHKFGNSIATELAMGQILLTVVNDADGDGEPDWNDAEAHQAGWDIRLYNSEWQHIKTATTNNQPYFPAYFTVAPGSYHICEVMQPGYTQSFARTITSWVTWPETGSANQSPASDEGEQCIAVEVLPAGVTSQLFGNTVEDTSAKE